MNNSPRSQSPDASRGDADQHIVDQLVAQTGISAARARELVAAFGTDLQTLVKAAQSLPSMEKPNVRSSRV